MDPDLLNILTESMAYRAPNGATCWCEGSVGLAQGLFLTGTPGEQRQAEVGASANSGSTAKLHIISDARIDGREELAAKLRSSHPELTALSPVHDLLLAAYERWGEACPEHPGLEVAAISLSTFRSSWGRRLGVDLKLHRMLPGNIGIAIGQESAFLRGVTDGLRSRYGVVSKWFQLRDDNAGIFSALVLSAGVGNERFQAFDDIAAGRRGLGYFGSAGLRVDEPISLVADWTGHDLVLGTSVAPFDRHAVILTLAVVDVARQAGDGARFVASGSYSLRF